MKPAAEAAEASLGHQLTRGASVSRNVPSPPGTGLPAVQALHAVQAGWQSQGGPAALSVTLELLPRRWLHISDSGRVQCCDARGVSDRRSALQVHLNAKPPLRQGQLPLK